MKYVFLLAAYELGSLFRKHRDEVATLMPDETIEIILPALGEWVEGQRVTLDESIESAFLQKRGCSSAASSLSDVLKLGQPPAREEDRVGWLFHAAVASSSQVTEPALMRSR